MSAFAQALNGDLDISANGQLTISHDVAQCTAWKLTNLFQFFLGEWFRDTRLGVPYLQYVFVKNPNLTLIANIFERVIKSAPGVAAITKMELQYTPRTRTLAPTFQAVTDTGAVLTGGIGVPFIISVKNGSVVTP